jgi:DNA-binding HxlR family transcriptional regulator
MKKTTKTKWDEAEMLCDGLSEDQDTLTREIITGLSDKWTLWVMSVLAKAEGPLRFSRVLEQVEGVSQKSLTKTLRQLERDGLVTRKMFAEVPPRVEYAITPIAIEMLDHVEPLWTWVAKSVGRFQEARTKFDER